MNNEKTPRKEIKRGDIFYIIDDPNKPSIGSEIWPNRAGLIVSNDGSNSASNAVEIVYLSTSDRKKPSPTHVTITSGNKKAIALCEQIHSVDISRLTDKFGHVPDNQMDEINSALMFSLQINTSKHNPQGIFKKWERYVKQYNLIGNQNTDIQTVTKEEINT